MKKIIKLGAIAFFVISVSSATTFGQTDVSPDKMGFYTISDSIKKVYNAKNKEAAKNGFKIISINHGNCQGAGYDFIPEYHFSKNENILKISASFGSNCGMRKIYGFLELKQNYALNILLEDEGYVMRCKCLWTVDVEIQTDPKKIGRNSKLRIEVNGFDTGYFIEQ